MPDSACEKPALNSLMRALLAVWLVLTLAPAGAGPTSLRGEPRIILGDRLVVAGTLVRLAGIDAPEDGQSCRLANGRIYDCGRISTTALMDLTAGVGVVCDMTGESLGGLPLATCRAGGYDLSKGMVHTGWALAWPRTGTVYAAVEGAARKARRGLWRGRFDMPWDWRRGVRAAIRSAVPPAK